MEQDKINPEYVQGFNEGYLLAKHRPELAASLDKLEKSSARLEGFGDGRKEFYLEKGKEKMPTWLKSQSREQSTGKTKEIDKDER